MPPNTAPTPPGVEKMKPVWDELERLAQRARRGGIRSLHAEEIAELDRLYRLSTVHLAQLRARAVHPALVENVNRLVGRAHSVVYAAPRFNPFMAVLYFYAVGFARSIVRTWRYQLAAVSLLLGGTVVGYAMADASPEAAYALVMGGEQIRLPGASQEQLEAVLRSGRDQGLAEKAIFAGFLLQHNTKVGFRAFVGGILGGVPTVMLMAYTGAFLGGYSQMHHAQGVAAEWWAWILPHGITEIGAACLCGGAGLMLGMALLNPGNRTRRQSLTAAGREGLNIALGVIPMFIAAGFIESFIRQSHMTTEQRLLFAAATALFWAVYIAIGYFAERRAAEEALGGEGSAAVRRIRAGSPI